MKVKNECRIGEYCRDHLFVHGAEAEEFRKAIEELIAAGAHDGEDCYPDAVTPEALQRLLDRVDARDSLAFVEAQQLTKRDPKPRNRNERRAQKRRG